MSRRAFVIAELTNLWRSVVDSDFARRFIEAGEGFGFEAYTQGMAQFERLSTAIDRSIQSMFILPHSSQTDEPASLASKATVDLTVARSTFLEHCFAFTPESLVFFEETTDMGENGPIAVTTGRRYAVRAPASIGPGQTGPVVVPAISLRSGRAGNNAQPGNIRRFLQPAASFANELASVVVQGSAYRLIAQPRPDVPVQSHVGAYLLFIGGANNGTIRRITGYLGPEPNGVDPNGGSFLLAATGQWQNSGTVGTFEVGEKVSTPTGEGIVWFQDATRIIIDRTVGTIATADVVTGASSGATTTLGALERSPDLVLESETAVWRVLDWEVDLGFTVTNEAFPEGGRIGMLETLGAERKVYRTDNEDQESYRRRVVTPADVVSPNAVIRASNRILTQIGEQGVLREVGLPLFRGMFYDGDPSSSDPQIAFAYDLDFEARPEDSLKVALLYEEFRAFFLLGVPKLGLGEFGFAYDDGPANAYDGAGPLSVFPDGYPLTAAGIYRQLWNAMNNTKAGGVGFDLYLEG